MSGGRQGMFMNRGGRGGRPRYADRGGPHESTYADNRYADRNLLSKSRTIQRKSRGPNPFLKQNEDVSMEDGPGGSGLQGQGGQRGRQRQFGKRGNGRKFGPPQGRKPGDPGHNFGPGWHKITILNGSQYGRDFVLQSIGQHSPSAFRPVAYGNLGVNSIFFLEDRESAESVAGSSGKFQGPDGRPVILRVTSFGTPPTATIDATCEQRIKTTLLGRYDPSLPGLNLENFHNSPDLVLDYYLPLYRPSVVAKILSLIQDSLPTLAYLDLSNNKLTALDSWQKLPQLTPTLKGLSLSSNRIREIYTLERLKGMQITEISLENNPLCDRFDDKDSYIRSFHN